MYITAGNNTLNITNQHVYRDSGVGLILKIEIARDSISIGDLETIVRDIGDNALEITVYNDNDEKVQILSGFYCEPNIIAKGSTYTVEFINESENTFQLGRHKHMIEELEKQMTSHSEQVDYLNTANEVQSSAIDDILLEVIPSIVTEVTAQVLVALGKSTIQ